MTREQHNRRTRAAAIEAGNTHLAHAQRHVSHALRLANSTKQPRQKIDALTITKERLHYTRLL